MQPPDPTEKELQQLEAQLRRLVPATPSEALTARLFAAFETPSDAAPAEVGDHLTPLPAPRKSRPASWAQPFAAAAAVALVAGVIALAGLSRPGGVTESPAPPQFVPSHAQNTYQGSNLDAIVFTDDHRPMQTVRHQFIDTYTWENPADGSQVEVRVPVERVRYIPVETD